MVEFVAAVSEIAARVVYTKNRKEVICAFPVQTTE